MGRVDQRQLDIRVDQILNRWPAVGLVVGVVSDGTVEAFTARGLADIASDIPVTQDTVFRIGSITKTFTAVAVMQLAEQGLVDVDAPANDYLRAFRLVPRDPGWRPATVRHLLTHTSGVPEWLHPSRMVRSGWFGETYPLDQDLPTLAQFYRGELRLAVEPGTVWAYTDHGFATLGQIVEDVSGQPLDRYLRQHVFDPLGMTSSDLRRSDRVRGRLATGYRIGARGARPVIDRQGVTAAAGAVYSTPADLARYLAALLRSGAGAHGSILRRESVATMFAPHYRPDPRIPGMGLAFWRVQLGGHAAVEHQGVVPGFNTQIFLAPEDGVGVLACTNGATNVLAATWVMGEAERLLRELVGGTGGGVRSDVPQRPEVWGELCGWYRPRAQRTDMQAWSMLGFGAEVRVQHGQLVVRSLGLIPPLWRGLRLHPDDPDDPDVFRIDLSAYGMDSVRVVFSRDARARVTGMHLDGILLSAEKRP